MSLPKLGEVAALKVGDRMVAGITVKRSEQPKGWLVYLMDVEDTFYRTMDDEILRVGDVLHGIEVLSAVYVDRIRADLAERSALPENQMRLQAIGRTTPSVLVSRGRVVHSRDSNPQHRIALQIWKPPPPIKLADGRTSRLSRAMEDYISWDEGKKRRFERLLELMHEKRPRQYELYNLCVLNDYTQAEAGRALGIASGNVSTWLKAARAYIDQWMGKS